MIVLIILAIVLIFFFLVIAHELGHFVAARRNGVTVEEFGVGFPPKIASLQRFGTKLSINLLPIGGFVRLKGEDGVSKAKDSFVSKGFWQKTKIIMAGVTVNFLIAYVIFTVLLATSMPPLLQGLPEFGPFRPTQVGSAKLTVFNVGQSSAAQAAGIQPGDELTSIDGTTFASNEQLKEFTKANAGKQITIVYVRSGQEKSTTATLGNNAEKGILGLVVQPLVGMRYPLWQAPIVALVLMAQLIWLTLAAFGGLIVGLFTRAQVSDQVAGPIGIVTIFSQLVYFGAGYIALFIASISLSLAVINTLPLPALDGGRQFILILQKFGLKISPERESFIHMLGFFALIALMVVVSVADILRLRG